MSPSLHPFSRSTTAIRLREHNLIDISEHLGADAVSIVGDHVTFTRPSVGESPRRRWHGRLGDWLVADGQNFWRIVSDDDLRTAEALLVGGAPTG